ncbi:hypothetical protein HDU90_004278 [Geranomyces variabilis]|nr:hypothetical protein HDU90_004278 [Geranomyces variabilis]
MPLQKPPSASPLADDSVENLEQSCPSNSSLPRAATLLRRRPSLPKGVLPLPPVNMEDIDETSNDLLPPKITRSVTDRMAHASSMGVHDSRAMRRAAKRVVRGESGSGKLAELEEGSNDVGIPSWAEHRSAGERVLYTGLARGTFMLALALGNVLLVNLQHNLVLNNTYGPPVVHGAFAVASFLVSMTGSAMVNAGFHHALTLIALTRGADCWIMASNYQTRNPIVLLVRALKCTLRNARETKVKELIRLAMVGTLLVTTWGLCLILSFAMVSVEWEYVPTGSTAATCTKPVYTQMSLETLRSVLLTASSLSNAIFEDADGVGVVSTMLPRTDGHVYVTADGIVVRATATYETATAGCSNVPANVSASSFYGISPIFCDSTYIATESGSQVFFKLGVPGKYCANCDSSSVYTYLSVAADLKYYTGQVSVLYDNDISGASRPIFNSYGTLVSGVDANLAYNFETAFNVVPAYLLASPFQARPTAMLASTLDSSGRFLSSPSPSGVARALLSVFQTIMLTYTESTDSTCLISASSGYGHAVLAQWVITTVEIMSAILAVTVFFIMWENQRSVRELQPHAYVRGLSIMRDPLRFMVSMRDCSAFWTRVTGGCDANGDLLTAAAAGLVCKYGEEAATRKLEVGHLMFGPPADIIPIRDGREYSGRPTLPD